MGNHKIAIVNSSSFGKIFPKHIDRLESIGKVKFFTFDSGVSGKELAKELNSYNIIVASVTPFFTEEFFEHKDELKLITRHGIGYNNIDIQAAKKHGTIVSIVPALVERDSVAENNITNLLNLMRRTSEAQDEVKNDAWENRAKFVGNSLFRKTVGVIGIGNIGSRVVEILRQGFHCNVLGYDPYKAKLEIENYGAKKVELDKLLERSDVICLCASVQSDANYHMISWKEIQKMKSNVYISNSARGALVNEEAVVEGLRSGKIGGYAADVLEEEPGRADHPYLGFANVVLTPHIAAYTMECLELMGEKCVSDCEYVAEGKLPERSVQVESLYIQKEG